MCRLTQARQWCEAEKMARSPAGVSHAEDDERGDEAVVAEVAPEPSFQCRGEQLERDQAGGEAEDHPDEARQQQLDKLSLARELLILEELPESTANDCRREDNGQGKAEILRPLSGHAKKESGRNGGTGAREAAERQAQPLHQSDPE